MILLTVVAVVCVPVLSIYAGAVRPEEPDTVEPSSPSSESSTLSFDLTASSESLSREWHEEIIDYCVDDVQSRHSELDEKQLRQYARSCLRSFLQDHSSIENLKHQRAEICSMLIGEMYEHLFRNVRERAFLDGLTGVYNRGYFDDKIEKEMARARRYQRSLSVLLLDLDDFKEINDRHGHQAGDQILVQFSNFLCDNLRDADVVCRYGGDEFVVILPETDRDNARKTAESVEKTIRDTRFLVECPEGGEGEVDVEASAGYASFSPENNSEDTVEKLLRRADASLYRAKDQKRDSNVALRG